eukprot:TRINITY_DN9313_c0_g3_i5.p1 TRINITY_DN9313_c0_g3~~TRINITY_DN9313_c0_g3_i5.p1  ORF type:complete len:464 (+),score=124.88 TRINITY_DN9313_c0_g3_i5:254-1645(+)
MKAVKKEIAAIKDGIAKTKEELLPIGKLLREPAEKKPEEPVLRIRGNEHQKLIEESRWRKMEIQKELGKKKGEEKNKNVRRKLENDEGMKKKYRSAENTGIEAAPKREVAEENKEDKGGKKAKKKVNKKPGEDFNEKIINDWNNAKREGREEAKSKFKETKKEKRENTTKGSKEKIEKKLRKPMKRRQKKDTDEEYNPTSRKRKKTQSQSAKKEDQELVEIGSFEENKEPKIYATGGDGLMETRRSYKRQYREKRTTPGRKKLLGINKSLCGKKDKDIKKKEPKTKRGRSREQKETRNKNTSKSEPEETKESKVFTDKDQDKVITMSSQELQNQMSTLIRKELKEFIKAETIGSSNLQLEKAKIELKLLREQLADIEEMLVTYTCPITTEVLMSPVIAEDGQTYEEAEIRRWLQSHDISPITQMKIGKRLTINYNARIILLRLKTQKEKIEKRITELIYSSLS